MSKEFLRDHDKELEQLLGAIEESILDASDEEIREDLLAEGEDPKELVERCQQMIAVAMRRVEVGHESQNGLAAPVARKSELVLLISRALSLMNLPRLPQLLPKPAVLGDEPGQEPDVREVSLVEAFDLSSEELERNLPWCGQSVEIARTFTETDGQSVYSAYTSEPTREHSGLEELNHSLVITLKGSNEQRCTARLSDKQKSAIFQGDRLPGDIGSIVVELRVQKA